MRILIDTNFAIACARQKIDFFNITCQLTINSIIWLIPNKVLEEIEKISINKGKSVKDRQAAILFLDILEAHKNRKTEFENIHLKRQNVDDAIIEYCDQNPEVVLATLDKRIKSKLKNKILTIKGKRFLRFV